MESIGDDLRVMQRTPLAPAHVAALREAGTQVVYAAGSYLARPGQLADRFVYVVDGEIEVVNAYTDERHLPSTLGPTQFMGEISFLNGGTFSMPMRAVRETGHPIITSFEPGEDWFYDYRSGATFNGPTLRAPHMHPLDQPVPGPAGQVPRNWMELLNE